MTESKQLKTNLQRLEGVSEKYVNGLTGGFLDKARNLAQLASSEATKAEAHLSSMPVPRHLVHNIERLTHTKLMSDRPPVPQPQQALSAQLPGRPTPAQLEQMQRQMQMQMQMQMAQQQQQ